MNKITLSLVDDHRLFRQGIASLIATFPEYEVLFEAGSGEEFCKKISPKFKPQIVLLDLNMPVMGGHQTSEWIKEHYPDVHVIVLSMMDDAESVLSLIKTGVKGYLLKDSEPSEFKAALDAVAGNNVYFPPFVSRYMAESFYKPSEDVKLNAREKEFLKLASSELTYKEIADKMFVSMRTVDGYRDNLFVKLNVKNRVGLVLYAIKNKLIEL
ncbi:response regulator transcription factor [Pedobacter metabolipauper]|uniref:LuxR family two component transcriptional regulator n=1 Tax=Pedobacter metabolipauper TaxID=425513 RepID=A0A4R6SZ81_9SPHI|nr:response regulator transcription factor [Pedobacter metabolipauper]TDQ11372.1 LuxR family two component transcriptional regulator [Pedobacter metabolipauper]